MSALLGAVLVGGRGRRMGRPKDVLSLGDRTLLARAWNAVAPVADPVVAQGTEAAVPGLQAAPDDRPELGPLGGIASAMRRAAADGKEGVVVLAVDLPRIPASLVVALVERWRGLDGCTMRAAVLQGDAGLEPLVGVYGVGLVDGLERRLAEGGSRAVHAWIDDLRDGVLRVPLEGLASAVGHADPLLNVNRPDDLVLADRLPAPAPPLVSVVGWKDAGKTSVAVGLVKALGRRGWRVMGLKHGHGFVLDTPGTDSHRLRCEAGAERVLMAGPDQLALLAGWGDAGEVAAPALAARYLAEADVVVAEGWKAASLPAIEVTGTARGGPGLWSPEAPDRDRFLARVAAGPSDSDHPRHPLTLDRSRTDLGDRLADLVETRIIPGWRR